MKKHPHQSQVSKQAAQDAIDRKLKILSDWLTNGIPYMENDEGHTLLDGRERKVLEYFPSSVRQFKLWDGSQNSAKLRENLPSLTRTGNDTLAKRPASAEQANRLTKALKLRAQNQQDSGRHSTVRRLKQELAIANETIALRVAELRDQQRLLRKIDRERARLAAMHDGHISELRRLLEQAETTLAQERLRNAELTALLSKMSPLKSK